jgi:hypothetical protein
MTSSRRPPAQLETEGYFFATKAAKPADLPASPLKAIMPQHIDYWIEIQRLPKARRPYRWSIYNRTKGALLSVRAPATFRYSPLDISGSECSIACCMP